MAQQPKLARKEFFNVITLKVIKFIGSIQRSFIHSISQGLFPYFMTGLNHSKMKTVVLGLLLLWGMPAPILEVSLES